MQNKQTSYNPKELFPFYISSNHVRLASIMQYCALIILLSTISRNFGAEALNKNATEKLDNLQVQAVYNPVLEKIFLNVSWHKPLDWDHIHSYDFKVSSYSSQEYCRHESFQTSKTDKTLSSIFLPSLLHKYEILPGCTYKISVVTNRSDLKKNMIDIIYSVPECVGKKCSCKSLAPIVTNLESSEITPGRLNISWQLTNKEVNNITNIVFGYKSNISPNNTFKTLTQHFDCNISNKYCILNNVDLLQINKQYQLRAIFKNTYNCTAYSYTNTTVTASKPDIDLKQTTKMHLPTVHQYKKTILEPRHGVNKNNSFQNNSKISSNDDKKMNNIKVDAIYSTTRYKIVLNITWDKPLDWQNIHSYDFKLSPNSSQCMHEQSFETINKDKTLYNILLPPPLNRYEILPGCTYKVTIITNRLGLGKTESEVFFTVPECVGNKCSCNKLTPQFKNFEATEISPGKFNISWVAEKTSNITKNKISDITLSYRSSSSEPLHSNYFKNIVLPSNVKNGSNYIILDNVNDFLANKSYELRGIFKNIYNCKAYLYTNITVTVIKIENEINKEENNSWVQVVLFLLLLSLVILAILYLLRRNRLIIKEILRNPLSLTFSRRRSRRSEARTSYIMVPPITKRQQEVNLLYVDKEIIDGEVDRYEFPRSRITIIRKIRNGAFGEVFLAKALGIAQQPGYTYVAVKTLKEKAPPEEVDDFLSEIEILKKIAEHPNIVRIFGCCVLKEPYLMVMEYVPCEDLKNYLLELRHKWKRKRTRNDSSSVFTDSSDGAYVLPDSPLSRKPSEGRPSVTETEYTSFESEGFPTPTEPFNNQVEFTLDNTELQNFALQIAKGMEHLEKIPIAHRDLAARNILINEYKTLKISDFGLSRVGPYVNSRAQKLPLRWLSLEAIEDHFYDSKGDVWSYAVVLWEIGTLGAFPYENIMDTMLPHYLQSGKRLPRPEICTDELYSLMLRCWSRDPQLRPSFQELVELLDVKKRRVYVDFNQLNPLYVFPPSKIPEFDKNSNIPQNDSTV